jgi:uncharacterized cupredoxin-like copper-binding protein
MTCKISAAVALVAIAALTGCTSERTASKTSPAAYVSDAPALVAAADWSKAETVTVALSNFRFTPNELAFQHDTPYRLHLVNQSASTHTFTSEAFFKAIAIQKIEPSPASGTTASLTRLDLAPGEQKDLYFVAVRSGTYAFDCSELLHDTFGMSGRIAIR